MKNNIHFPKKIELLAPVGRWKALEPVLESGADAVYLAGKDYNMRRHRSDFNLDRDQIAQAVEKVHTAGAKIYVTVNSLLSDTEIEHVEDYLQFLHSAGVDAIIVQDLGVIQVIKDSGIKLPLHASTMMNIHSPEGAMAAAKIGIERIICSRDITLNHVEEMGRESGLEMEYFVHGDMCFVQSGQCYTSGMIFGNSSNRGKCMKPCRWPYDLINLSNGSHLKTQLEGKYLLAVKDMCLLQRIPELIQSGIVSLKIEGRMKPPEFISKIIRIYRAALDQYTTDPFGYINNLEFFEKLYQERVRDFSTSVAFHKPGGEFIGSTGEREPLFLSTGAKEHEINLLDNPKNITNKDHSDKIDCQTATPELAVHVATPEAAEQALENGADWIYIGGEVPIIQGQGWKKTILENIIQRIHKKNRKVGLLTPRITQSIQLKELAWLFNSRLSNQPDAVLVHNLGSLHLLKEITDVPIHADFSFNAINLKSLELLANLGIKQAMVSLEASFDVVKSLAKTAPLPLECIVHGPLSGMYTEHCLISFALRGTSADEPCRGMCRYLKSGLKNKFDDVYPVETDQYCRNHILLSKDLACLQFLNDFSNSGVRSLRIEGQYYDSTLVGLVTELYTQKIKNPGLSIDRDKIKRLLAESPRGFGLGAYPKGIFKEKRKDYIAIKKDVSNEPYWS